MDNYSRKLQDENGDLHEELGYVKVLLTDLLGDEGWLLNVTKDMTVTYLKEGYTHGRSR